MGKFRYQAKKGPTEIVTGTVEAQTQKDAVRLIERDGFIPIEIVLVDGPGSGAPAKHKPDEVTDEELKKILRAPKHSTPKPPLKTAHSGKKEESHERGNQPKAKRGKKVKFYDLCIFTRQLAGMLRSNLPIMSALEFIRYQTHNPGLVYILNKVVTEVQNGVAFSDAIEKHGSKCFDARYLSMIRSGESSGSLDVAMETLADNLETEEETASQIRSAMAYPILIAVVGAGTLFFMFTFVLPRLTDLFSQAYENLPFITKVLMMFGEEKWQFRFWGLAAMSTSFFVILFVAGPGHKKRRQRLIAGLPLIGAIKMKSDIARFCGTLGMLIQNGIPIYQAIEVTRPVLGNDRLERDLENAQHRIMGGEMLTSVLHDAKHFPSFVSHMVSVGEESGRLSESMNEVSRFYSREATRGIKTLTSLIEPLFILALSLIVGLIVAGIMLPIFDMNWMEG